MNTIIYGLKKTSDTYVHDLDQQLVIQGFIPEKELGIVESFRDTDNEAEPISIDFLIETLKSIKEQGSTHVVIDPEYDYMGYRLEGVNIVVMDKNVSSQN